MLGPRGDAAQTAASSRPSFCLQESPGRGALHAGDEVRINYGDNRSNEELLFNYGFAVRNNDADALMVAPPLPRDEGDADEAAMARAVLLHARGRAPRAFLPMPRRRGGPTQEQAIEGAGHFGVKQVCV